MANLNWEQLQTQIEKSAEDLHDRLDEYKNKALYQIEEAKKEALLIAIKDLTKRIERIEDALLNDKEEKE